MYFLLIRTLCFLEGEEETRQEMVWTIPCSFVLDWRAVPGDLLHLDVLLANPLLRETSAGTERSCKELACGGASTGNQLGAASAGPCLQGTKWTGTQGPGSSVLYPESHGPSYPAHLAGFYLVSEVKGLHYF